MSKSKKIGTRFESGCVRWLNDHDIPAYRAALNGAQDKGDIHGLPHGGIAECKNVKQVGRKALKDFQRQTLTERENAGAGWAVLIMHRSGCDQTGTAESFKYNIAMLTIRDFDVALRGTEHTDAPDDMWVSMSMWEFVDMLRSREESND
jgi:hypothetical protein